MQQHNWPHNCTIMLMHTYMSKPKPTRTHACAQRVHTHTQEYKVNTKQYKTYTWQHKMYK